MIFDFKVRHLEFKDKKGILIKESAGKVKCKKAFPIYEIDGKDELFKPLSKTKPWSTPFFAISEVFWSTVINRCFDETAPVYKLAECEGYDKKYKSRYSKGVLVPSVITADEELMNLLEYYRAHPCRGVNIDEYINYCGYYYDYTSIMKAPLFRCNKRLGESLAFQILLSLLKQDLNFHYENIHFITKKGKITSLAPPIDHEFSLPFLFPEGNELTNNNPSSYYYDYFMALIAGFIRSEESNLEAISKNLDLIRERYPDVVERFVRGLKLFIEEAKHTRFSIPRDFVGPCSSYEFQEYEKKFHEHKDMTFIEGVNTKPVDIDYDLVEVQAITGAVYNADTLRKLLQR